MRRLRGDWGDYELLGFGESRRGGRKPSYPGGAESFVRQFMDDYVNLQTLRGFLASHGGVDLSRLSDHDVLREVAWLLESGGAWIVEIERVAFHAGTAPSPQVPELAPEPAPASDHWIELHLVDHESAEALAGVKVKLRLPDRSEAEYTTDPKGLVRITGLPDGSWDVVDLLEHVEVVGTA